MIPVLTDLEVLFTVKCILSNSGEHSLDKLTQKWQNINTFHGYTAILCSLR